MQLQVYEFTDYRDYLRSWIQKNQHIRGCRSKLAHAAGCHRTYLSQVLAGNVELTPDQAIRAAGHFGLDSEEAFFFLDLVLLSRAGSKELKNLIEQKISLARTKREDLATRYRKPSLSEQEEATFYYSSWIPAAVQLSVALPGMKTPGTIAQKLKIPLRLVKEVIGRLEAYGLIVRTQQGWVLGKKNLHLPRDSSLSATHHTHWRTRAVQDSIEGNPDSIHYSAVYTLSRSDVRRLRALITEMIDRSREIVQPSAEEEMVGFLCDFFIL